MNTGAENIKMTAETDGQLLRRHGYSRSNWIHRKLAPGPGPVAHRSGPATLPVCYYSPFLDSHDSWESTIVISF